MNAERGEYLTDCCAGLDVDGRAVARRCDRFRLSADDLYAIYEKSSGSRAANLPGFARIIGPLRQG